MFWKVEIHIKTPLFTNIINSNFYFLHIKYKKQFQVQFYHHHNLN